MVTSNKKREKSWSPGAAREILGSRRLKRHLCASQKWFMAFRLFLMKIMMRAKPILTQFWNSSRDRCRKNYDGCSTVILLVFVYWWNFSSVIVAVQRAVTSCSCVWSRKRRPKIKKQTWFSGILSALFTLTSGQNVFPILFSRFKGVIGSLKVVPIFRYASISNIHIATNWPIKLWLLR